MGLFDGDTGSLEAMLAPLLASQAAKNPINAQSPFPEIPSTPLPFGEPGGVGIPNLPPEVNPSPVMPGQVPLPQPNPLQPSPEEMAGSIRMPGAGTPADVGAALAAPLPQGPTPSGEPLAAAGSTDVSGRAKTEEEKRPSLAQALKGVQAPKAPELQKIATPNAPRPTTAIKGGDLQALLMALNAGAGRQLPLTLGKG